MEFSQKATFNVRFRFSDDGLAFGFELFLNSWSNSWVTHQTFSIARTCLWCTSRWETLNLDGFLSDEHLRSQNRHLKGSKTFPWFLSRVPTPTIFAHSEFQTSKPLFRLARQSSIVGGLCLLTKWRKPGMQCRRFIETMTWQLKRKLRALIISLYLILGMAHGCWLWRL